MSQTQPPTHPASLYDQYFTSEERRDLAAIPHYDLTGEISLQRILLSRLQAAAASRPLDFEMQLDKARLSHIAISALLTLVNTHRRCADPSSDSTTLIDQALRLAAQQLDVPAYLTLPAPQPASAPDQPDPPSPPPTSTDLPPDQSL
jgi:hypothetical protein